jgi:hypothetical protein
MPFISKVGSKTGNREKKAPSGPIISRVVSGNATTDMNITGMTILSGVSGNDDGFAYIPFNMPFTLFNISYPSNGAITASSMYWCTNNVIGFGTGVNTISWTANSGIGFLIGNRDRRTNTCYVSYSSSGGVSILNIAVFFQNFYNDGVANAGKYYIRLIRDTNGNGQYLELRCNSAPSVGGSWSVTNGSTFNPQNYVANVASGKSIVLYSSGLLGSSWTYYPDSYVDL